MSASAKRLKRKEALMINRQLSVYSILPTNQQQQQLSLAGKQGSLQKSMQKILVKRWNKPKKL